MRTIVFAIPVRNEKNISGLIGEMEKSCAVLGVSAKFVLAVNNSTTDYSDYIGHLADKSDGQIVALQLGNMDGRPFSYAYIKALEEAPKLGEIVVEMDAGGSFPVIYAMEMVQILLGDPSVDAVFSNRFFHSGRVWNMFNHRPSRIATSLTGTLLANAFLPLGKVIPDMTSGLSVVRSDVVKKVFQKYPNPDEYVSVKTGPGHFFQTEWRFKILSVTKRVAIHNIRMGEFKERKPAKLGNSTLFTALKALFVLRNDHK